MLRSGMARGDEDDLAWHGTPTIPAAGGFVDGVALNQKRRGLAVDPDGLAAPAAPSTGSRRATNLLVERLDDRSEAPVQRNGRVRMKPT